MTKTHLRHGRPHRIRGWGLIKARCARLAQRRFMRLIHYTLTVFDAADEEADLVILEEILVGAQVTAVKRRREITIKLPTDRLIITLRTEREFDAWYAAFRDAARIATNYYKIVTTRELGTGAFSTVYFGFDREDGHHVAVKVVEKTRCTRAELTCAETEARMMAFLRHPSVVLCRDIFDAPEVMHVVMEYMSGATLEQRMLCTPPQMRRFSETVASTIMAHVLSALAYLESEGVCHRDVKPDNVLLSNLSNDNLWATTARLSDFGLAAFVESDFDLTDVVGTPHYVAPEVVSRDEKDEWLGYGPPVDVWAAGVIMYWMLMGGRLPFDGDDPPAIFKSIRAAKLDLDGKEWDNVSDEAKSLLKSLLHPQPRTRLRASAATTHPWLLRAQDVSLPAMHAARLQEGKVRRPGMSARSRFRSMIWALLAVRRLALVTGGGDLTIRRRCECRARSMRPPGKKNGTEKKMTRAPERAPTGTDGLGYNVGFIPSFAPKRRAKASVSSPMITVPRRDKGQLSGGEESSVNGTNSVRMSKDSGQSVSSGSNTPSGERGVSVEKPVPNVEKRAMSFDKRAVSVDRKSVGSSGGTLSKTAWAFLLRGRGTDDSRGSAP